MTGDGPVLHVRAPRGAAPLGAIFGGIGALAAGAVAMLGLDRVPVTLCVFKGLTGWPCPTCGSTRTLAHLAALDIPGAVAMNPAAALAAALLSLWALADLALLAGGRALALEISPRLGRVLRLAVPALLALNWAYLVAAGR